MLKGINKLLTGDLLKMLCDMGHGDELVIADANFPAEALASRLIRLPGIDGVQAAEAILSVFPLDTYSTPAFIMDLTDGDKAEGMSEPDIWKPYADLTGGVEKIERFAFYERAKKAYCIIQTGEERQYANLLLVKGVVLADDIPSDPPKKKSSGGITRGADYYRKF
jgi:L-fucose mutarotase